MEGVATTPGGPSSAADSSIPLPNGALLPSQPAEAAPSSSPSLPPPPASSAEATVGASGGASGGADEHPVVEPAEEEVEVPTAYNDKVLGN